MKKLLRIFIIVIIGGFVANVALSVAIFSFFSVSVLPDSMGDADISILDLIKPQLDPAKKEVLEKAINEKSTQLGKETAKKIMNSISVGFTGKTVDTSNIENPKKLPSLEAVLQTNEENAQKGIEQGLNLLKNAEKDYQEIKNKSLSTNNN